jgi:hypothetical protein
MNFSQMLWLLLLGMLLVNLGLAALCVVMWRRDSREVRHYNSHDWGDWD